MARMRKYVYHSEQNKVMDIDGEVVANARLVENNVILKVQGSGDIATSYPNESHSSPGILIVGEEKICWIDGEYDFCLDYKNVMIHAVQRAENGAKAGIYMQLNPQIEGSNEESATLEMWFIPEKQERIDDIFLAICDCSARHPDDDIDNEEDFGA